MTEKRRRQLLARVRHDKPIADEFRKLMAPDRLAERLAKMPSFVRDEIARLQGEIARLEKLLLANQDSNVVIPGWDGIKPRIVGLPTDSTIRFIIDKHRHFDVCHAERSGDARKPGRLLQIRGSNGQLIVLPNAANTITIKLGEYE